MFSNDERVPQENQAHSYPFIFCLVIYLLHLCTLVDNAGEILIIDNWPSSFHWPLSYPNNTSDK